MIGLLALVYLLCSLRYYPGRLADSLVATLTQLLTVAPFSVGATILIAALFRKSTGERLPWGSVVRIFLTIGIVIEFFYGLHDYLGMG